MAMEAWSSETLSDARDRMLSALIEDDNGALLIAMRGGIRQLVDGKPKPIRFQASGRQFRPDQSAPGSRWRSVDRNVRTGVSCMCTREGRIVFARSDGLSGDFDYQLSLRIVKAIFGSPRVMASTVFATSPSPRFP